MDNFQEENLEQKWNETSWGKIVQVLIWPLGLYMMFTVPYFTKKTRHIIAGFCGLALIINIFGGEGMSTEDCSGDVKAYEFGRDMATWSSMRGGIGLSKSIEEYNNTVYYTGYNSGDGCVKRGYKDAQAGKDNPY